MTPNRRRVGLAVVASLLSAPTLVAAGCSTATTGARCIVAPASLSQASLSNASEATPAVQAGDVLERGAYSIILNADYYGLPPVADGWVYMRIGHDAFRVDWSTQQVLERVTDRAAANF